MKPSVGRIVHYTNLGDKDGKYPPETQAALVTGAKLREPVHAHTDAPCSEDCFVVDLHIFYRTGDFFMFDVPFNPEPLVRGHWTWPPQVD